MKEIIDMKYEVRSKNKGIWSPWMPWTHTSDSICHILDCGWDVITLNDKNLRFKCQYRKAKCNENV